MRSLNWEPSSNLSPMKSRIARTTTAVIGEGPTEKYYLKSLEGGIRAQVRPIVPNHATSMLELERLIERCVDDGYDQVFCLIDMDNKKEGRNRDNYLRLKSKYHGKVIRRKRQGTETKVCFYENERCLEIWFLYHFRYTTQPYHSSEELAKELERLCGYEKTEEFLAKKCKGLHNFLLAHGGDFNRALANAERSMRSREADGRSHTYSEMAAFLVEVLRREL